jgi:hypothetical protein
VAAKPLTFNLALDDHSHDDEHNIQAQYGRGMIDVNKDVENTARLEDSDARLMEMLAAQAAHREVDSLGADEDSIADDEKLEESEKKDILQRGLNMAASNGDVERVRKLLKGKAREFVDVNMPDEEGTVPLIYASCFVCLLSPCVLVILADCVTGTPRRCFGAFGRRRACRPAGSQPVERVDVGNDEPTQDHRKDSFGSRSVAGYQVVVWWDGFRFRAARERDLRVSE